MRFALILIVIAAIDVTAFLLHPGIGIAISLLSYFALDGLRDAPKKKTAEQKMAAYRRSMGYKD